MNLVLEKEAQQLLKYTRSNLRLKNVADMAVPRRVWCEL